MESMSLKFSALEVGSGDAFLLEDGEKKYLFDAGGSKTTIVNLLKSKKISKLDLAICSHNDIDHANGFIGILKSPIDIEEIWLPGTWACILQYIKDYRVELEELDLSFETCKSDSNQCRLFDYNIDIFLNGEYVEIDEFDKNLSFFSELYDNDLYRELKIHLRQFYYHHTFYYKFAPFIIQLDRIIEIAALAYQKGCKIRWFEPLKCCTKKDVAYGFRALNSYNVVSVRKMKPQSLLYLLALTVENEYSLIFEYLHDDKPIIRFSADSALCCQSESPYSRNILITAPHHGAYANASVYQNIKGSDIVWVRSDRKSSKRPCPDFKNLGEKYCMACYSMNFKKEVCFMYDNAIKKWNHITGNKCNC